MPGVGDQVGPPLIRHCLRAAPIGNQFSRSQDGRLGRLRACSNRTVRRRSPPARRGSRHSPRRATDHHIYSLRWSTTRRCRRFRQCRQKTVVPASSHVSAAPAGSARRERPTLRRTVCSTDAASLTERLQHRCQGSMRADHQPASSPSGSRTGDRRAQIESLNGHPWRGRRA
ncbi:MAG: hypothetical protein ACI9JD_001324 [Rhodococcus sp. (in: high G+C Gram-positive bacteria)]